jgi:hypothetical protein
LRAQKAVLRSILEQLVLAVLLRERCAVAARPQCPTVSTTSSRVHSDNRLKFSDLRLGRLHAFTHIAAIAAEAQRHDAYRLRTRPEPNPEESRSHVAHLDAQHRLDGTTLNLAGRAFRARGRWLRQHPLNNCQASALGIRDKVSCSSMLLQGLNAERRLFPLLQLCLWVR